ncbi:nitroreductase family protein [Geomonas sp. RF6]|nr:nitroreductase family protein [Geomonas sp. RF6]UFS72853.1 nitroreductase family protein [Geomonas sp. RF6]
MIELLRKRRSIRSYTPEPVDQESVALLVESLLRSPSSRDLKPWEFIVVDDRQLLNGLAQSKAHSASFLKNAALAVVVIADPQKCDVWIEDSSLAAILLQMTATSLGLGSCWVQIRLRSHASGKSSEEYVRELLGIPQHMHVLSVIGIGHPNEMKKGIPADQLEYGKVRHNGYHEPWR